eukprot:Skav207097  [mRNA]  locus=scaffold2123:33996:35696:+ [translate_table: standard]
MVVVKLEHADLSRHQACIFKHLRTFRKEGQLCDVVMKSRDGKQHGAHTAVLCAASADLKNMLLGPFVEASQVQAGQPVEMAASDAAVFALLEYIYGEEPQVDLEDSLELLRLADAYNFSELATAIEAGLRASLDNAPVEAALKVLQLTQDLRKLQIACEEKIAANFELCIELGDFIELSPGQLARVLRRADLRVSHEEVVVEGLFKWLNASKDRMVQFGALLQNVDFESLSSSNLARLKHLSASMGPVGYDLQREIGDALEFHKKRSAANWPEAFQPKRRCLHNWSPELGASSQAPQKVLPRGCLCCHDGAIYTATFGNSNPSSILRWKPGDAESLAVAGRGARVNGVNDLGIACEVSVSCEGEIFVADVLNHRLLSFQNGSGNVVLRDVDIRNVSCSPNGDVYVLTQSGRAVEKVVGSTLHTVISSNDLPAELQFQAWDLFVMQDDVIYLSDWANSRILQINPSEAEPVLVGEAPNKENSCLSRLFVTEDEKMYVADCGQRKLWAIHPGDAVWTEVLVCARELECVAVVIQGRSLYVGIGRGDGEDSPDTSGVFEYSLAPELQLG